MTGASLALMHADAALAMRDRDAAFSASEDVRSKLGRPTAEADAWTLWTALSIEFWFHGRDGITSELEALAEEMRQLATVEVEPADGRETPRFQREVLINWVEGRRALLRGRPAVAVYALDVLTKGDGVTTLRDLQRARAWSYCQQAHARVMLEMAADRVQGARESLRPRVEEGRAAIVNELRTIMDQIAARPEAGSWARWRYWSERRKEADGREDVEEASEHLAAAQAALHELGRLPLTGRPPLLASEAPDLWL